MVAAGTHGVYTASPSSPSDSRAPKFSPRHTNPELSLAPQALPFPSSDCHGRELCPQLPLAVREAEKEGNVSGLHGIGEQACYQGLGTVIT